MIGQKLVKFVFVILVWLSCAFIIIRFGPRIYNDSEDLGWHYALAYFLAQNMRLPGVADHLGPMVGYPPGFHFAAALSNTILSSPLLGMQYLALLSIFGCYYIISSIILSRRFGPLIAVLFLLILLCFRVLLGGVIGYEVINNGFYPQLVGTALFLTSMCLLSRLGSSPARYFFLAVATTFFTAWVYTLSAAWLAFGACVLFLLLQPARTVPIRWALANFVALPLVVLLHPTFVPMVRNAGYEGGSNSSYYWLTHVIGFALVILFLVLLIRSRHAMRSRADALLGSVLLASVAGIIVQASLFQLVGLGSRYAITKHVFLASTVFVAGLSIILGDLISKAVGYKNTRVYLPPGVQNSAIAVLAVGILFIFQPWTPLPTFITYVRDARLLEQAHVQSDLAGNTIPLNKDFSLSKNFAVLVAHFRGGWRASGHEVFQVLDNRARPLGAPMGAKYALISKRQWEHLTLAGAPQECLVHTPASLAVSVLILSRCYPDRNGEAEVNFCIDTWIPGDGTKTGDAFAEPEFVEDGVFQWTVSTHSELEVPLRCKGEKHTIRILVAFAVTERTLNSFHIEVNGQPISLRRRPVRMGQLFEGTLPSGLTHADDQSALIALKVASLDQPQGSRRHLGVSLRRIEFLGKALTDWRL